MESLRWSWLAAPYLFCTAVIARVSLAAALTRGDRVMRLGVIASSVTALPWALCQGLAMCTTDPALATRLLRIAQGTVGMIGPNLLLVLLATSGQLERHRWLARVAALIGAVSMALTWATPWVVPGVQVVPWGVYYMSPGPLTGVQVSQLIVWLLVGLVIVRRTTPSGERRRNTRLILGVLVCGAIGSLDTLVLYRIAMPYPMAWLSASTAAVIALYLVLRTDFLRPQGFDTSAAVELLAFMAAAVLIVALSRALEGVTAVVIATITAAVWTILTGVAWAVARVRRAPVAEDRALQQFIARVTSLDTPAKIAERLTTLWRSPAGIVMKRLRTDLAGLDREVRDWLVKNPDAVAVTDLATMRLGALRPKLEALGGQSSLLVPLVDRGELVGLVEADYDKALRESERGLVAESAKAAARALTFIALSQAAARERETAREVEVADALRLQASASRESELGKWAVAAEYRTAAHTTGAGWSAIELGDGRLALLATEAQAHGVPAALATAALTGAFAAATIGATSLDDILTAMRATADGVMRGGEPVAAFLAIIGSDVQWACAGHPGAFLVGPVASLDAGAPLGSAKASRPEAVQLGPGFLQTKPRAETLDGATRGTTPLPPDTLLVVASSGLRGLDDAAWQAQLRQAAFASGRLAAVLVEDALRRGTPTEDLLAVVVRAR
ncbi:MAG TPA: SpoIIE family protein phosphatase [Kofleriaceae bacterium]|nr:SpoIIE family protein phosphatase [Kofleriaceae bacterium]